MTTHRLTTLVLMVSWRSVWALLDMVKVTAMRVKMMQAPLSNSPPSRACSIDFGRSWHRILFLLDPPSSPAIIIPINFHGTSTARLLGSTLAELAKLSPKGGTDLSIPQPG